MGRCEKSLLPHEGMSVSLGKETAWLCISRLTAATRQGSRTLCLGVCVCGCVCVCVSVSLTVCVVGVVSAWFECDRSSDS